MAVEPAETHAQDVVGCISTLKERNLPIVSSAVNTGSNSELKA